LQILKKDIVLVADAVAYTVRVPIVATHDNPLILSAVCMSERNATGNNVPDVGTIYISPAGGDGIVLKSDNFDRNMLTWSGRIELTSDMEVVLVWFIPKNTYTLSYQIMLLTKEELSAPGSSQQNVIGQYPFGKLKCISVNAPDTNVDTGILLQPGAGLQWQVIEMWGFHTDAAAHFLSWHYIDTNLTLDLGKTAPSCAQYIQTSISKNEGIASLCGNLMITNAVYPRLVSADVLGAGTHITARGLVLEFSGGN
jgi:hypothetical protein